jgi:hypothetical protein
MVSMACSRSPVYSDTASRTNPSSLSIAVAALTFVLHPGPLP